MESEGLCGLELFETDFTRNRRKDDVFGLKMALGVFLALR